MEVGLNPEPISAVSHEESRMKTVVFLSLAVCTLNCFAQTNSVALRELFSIPSLDIRVASHDIQSPPNGRKSGDSGLFALAPSSAQSTSQVEAPNSLVFNAKYVALSLPTHASEDIVHDSFRTDFDRALYHRLDRAGYFTRPPIVSRTALDRGIDNIFNPEVVQIGKTSVSCSIYTAIKRRNPLCLANPIFLNISW